jgi:hypothetical protein
MTGGARPSATEAAGARFGHVGPRRGGGWLPGHQRKQAGSGGVRGRPCDGR